MANEKKPNATCVARIKEINSSWEAPPPAHPDWKIRLKRNCYVEGVKSVTLKPEASQLGITPDKLGTTFVCWGRVEIDLGIGGEYAFSLEISKGRDINFVNIISATLIGGEPVIPPLPPVTDAPPASQPGSPAPAGNGSKDVYIARQCAIERVTDCLRDGKLSAFTAIWGVSADPWDLADAFVRYFQTQEHPIRTNGNLPTQEHD